MTSSNPPKFIIDTDPGVDDAMAIFMALEAHRKRQIQILAICLVEGNSSIGHQRNNILRIFKMAPQALETYGKIPVFVGAHEGLCHFYDNDPPYHGNNGFCDVIFPDVIEDDPVNPVIQKEHAANAINRMIGQYPGEITIVTLGPLTNIALAMKLNKNFEGQIKRMVSMGGNMDAIGNVTTSAEFNFYADPEAANVVIKRMENLEEVKVTLVTWELCRRSQLTWEWRQNVLAKVGGERIKMMNALEEEFHKKSAFPEQWGLCDTYAMVVALRPDCIIKSTNYHAAVEIKGAHTRGQVVLEKRFVKDGGLHFRHGVNVHVVQEIDREVLRQLVLEAMTPA